MTSADIKSRVVELEAKVAWFKEQVEELTPKKAWWNHIGPRAPASPESIKEQREYGRNMRQLDTNRELDPSPQFIRLHQQHRTLIRNLRRLAKFKSNLAAAEYVHREFT